MNFTFQIVSVSVDTSCQWETKTTSGLLTVKLFFRELCVKYFTCCSTETKIILKQPAISAEKGKLTVRSETSPEPLREKLRLSNSGC
jgi:hypothetical protein